MAEYRRIEYRIEKDGTVTETVIGGSGPNCVEATQAIEASLGEVEDQERLPAYYDEEEGILNEATQQINP